MPRKITPLTDTQIKQAKPQEREYNLTDGDGLMLRVKPSGSKLWIYNYYRPYSKKRANLSLGAYPAISLKGARDLRREMQRLLAERIDPSEHLAKVKLQEQHAHSMTLEHVTLEWHKVKKTKVTEDYATDILRSLENHVFPALGKAPISKLTATQVIKELKPIAAKKQFETVKRLCQRLNEIMTYAVNTGIIEHNPLSGIYAAFESPTKNHMPTLPPDKLPDLMKSVANASIRRTTRCLIEWQLHTMTRPAEAAKTRWDEIDFENMVWTIPDERMKMRRPHLVPLTPQMLNLLETMKPISGHREYVFPADRDPRKHTNSQTANMALKRMGYKDLLVSHGLRALASTTLNEKGFDPDVIESALAHTDKNSVRKAYNRANYLDRRRELMQWWSDHIDRASSGSFSLAGQINKSEEMS